MVWLQDGYMELQCLLKFKCEIKLFNVSQSGAHNVNINDDKSFLTLFNLSPQSESTVLQVAMLQDKHT